MAITPDNIKVTGKVARQTAQDIEKLTAVLNSLQNVGTKNNINFVKLTSNLKAAQKSLGLTNSQVKNLAKSMGVLDVRNHRNSMSLSVLRSKLLMFNFTAGLAAKVTVDLVKAFGEQERAEKQVTQSLISTNYASGQTTESIKALAASLQEATGFGDEMILSSSALLNTFTNISGETFPQAQTAILDVAAAMYQGNVTMESMKTTTIQVGKALNDPIAGMNALSRVGIQFSAQQKTQIRRFVNLRDVQSAQAIIMKELNKQYGESSTKTGDVNIATRSLASAISDMQQAMGEHLEKVIIPMIDGMTAFAKALDPRFIYTFIASLAGLAAALEYVKLKSLVATSQITLQKAAMDRLTFATKAFTSSTGVGLLLIGLSAAVSWFTRTKKSADDAGTSIENMTDIVNSDTIALANKTDELKKEQELQKTVNKIMEGSGTKRFRERDALKAAGEWQSVYNRQKKEGEKALKKWSDAQPGVIADLKKEQKELQDIVILNKEKNETEFMGPEAQKQLTTFTKKLNNQKRLNELTKDYGLFLRGATTEEKLKSKVSSALGITVEELQAQYGKDKDGLVDTLERYAEQLDIVRERAERMQNVERLQSEITGFIIQGIDQRTQALDAEKDRDIERIKGTSRYKLAQERGDKATMDRLEKQAASKTLGNRKKEFRAKQMLAVSNITIDYLQAMAKDSATQGILSFITSHPFLALASAAAIGTVMSQKAPEYAKGGDFITKGPQMIMVGDNVGGQEHVQITPLSSPNINGPQRGSVNISFSGNVISQDFIENEAIPMIKEAVRRGADIGIS